MHVVPTQVSEGTIDVSDESVERDQQSVAVVEHIAPGSCRHRDRALRPWQLVGSLDVSAIGVLQSALDARHVAHQLGEAPAHLDSGPINERRGKLLEAGPSGPHGFGDQPDQLFGRQVLADVDKGVDETNYQEWLAAQGETA